MDQGNNAPLFPGEHHAILNVNGRPGNANFMGPGTEIIKRVKRGDEPRTQADKVAEAHDIRYSLGIPEEEADSKMLDALDRVEQRNGDTRLNINMGRLPIKAKMAAQKRGIIAKDAFSRTGKATDPADKQLLQSKLSELEQSGYGSNNPFENKKPEKKKRRVDPYPGDSLLKRYSKRVKRMSGSGMTGGAFDFSQLGCGRLTAKKYTKKAIAERKAKAAAKASAKAAATANQPPQPKSKKKSTKGTTGKRKTLSIVRDVPDTPSSKENDLRSIRIAASMFKRKYPGLSELVDDVVSALDDFETLPGFSEDLDQDTLSSAWHAYHLMQAAMDKMNEVSGLPKEVGGWATNVVSWVNDYITDESGWDMDHLSAMADEFEDEVPLATSAAPKKKRKRIKPFLRSRLTPEEDEELELYDEPPKLHDEWQDYFHSKDKRKRGKAYKLAGTLKSRTLRKHLVEQIHDAAPSITRTAYGRRLLATELGPGDRNGFNKKMQQAKDAKHLAYPWIKPFMKEVKDYIIPIMMIRQDDYLEDIGNEHYVRTKPIMKGMKEWKNERTKDRDPTLRGEGGEGLNVAGEGLNVAGAGLKLAGQGMAKSIHSKLYGMAKAEKYGFGADFAKQAAIGIGKAMHRHAKRMGNAHLIPHLVPHITHRLHAHFQDPEAHAMTGSGFWGNVWKGIKTAWKYGKKIGGPLLDAASYAAPFIAPEFAPALAGIQAARKFASKPSISGAKDLYQQATKKK